MVSVLFRMASRHLSIVPFIIAHYRKDRLPGNLHELIVEVAAEKKSTKKK